MASPKVGVSDNVVPVLDGELGGEDGAAAGVAVVEDFEQIGAALALQEGEAPFVQVAKPGLGQPVNELQVGIVGSSLGECVEEPGRADGVRGRSCRIVDRSDWNPHIP